MERTDTAGEVSEEDAGFAGHPDSVLAHAAEVAWVLVEDEVVVYHAPSSTSHVLNPSAALVWRCVDGQSSLAEILVDIADIFQLSVPDLLDQVAPMVGEWAEAGLVDVVDRS